MSILYDIEAKIIELREATDLLIEMQDNWNSDDPCAQACSDPGLQFSLENDMDDIRKDLIELMETYIRNHK